MNATMHNFKRIIKMLGLQVMLSTFLLLLMQGVTESSSAQAQPQYRELAAHWAPIVSQDIDDANTRAEYITRFNYDGDWRGNNNWNHLNRYELPDRHATYASNSSATLPACPVVPFLPYTPVKVRPEAAVPKPWTLTYSNKAINRQVGLSLNFINQPCKI